MTGSDESLAAVGAAADALVTAFGSHDRDAYFACFAPESTFLFHTTPGLLTTRAAYEREWAAWEADGFHVDSCSTTDRHIGMLTSDVAVLTHRVRTRLAGSDEEQRECETIVFRRTPDGGWLAVHEHLSPDPEEQP
jgi:ketosteroid isomerase-like protein